MNSEGGRTGCRQRTQFGKVEPLSQLGVLRTHLLVPPPRSNLVRYHGVLAANAADRSQIVPGPKGEVEALAAPTSDGEPTPAQRRHRLTWAVLLARVFQFEVTECPACGGRMKIVAAVTSPRSLYR